MKKGTNKHSISKWKHKLLIAIIAGFISISEANAAIRYPTKIYPSGLDSQTVQHAVINDANWYGYNSSHSTKKWAWRFDFSDLDDTKTYDLSGTILNQVSGSENVSSAVVTFNDKACTLNYSFSNNEILWADRYDNGTYGNDFNYFSIGHMTTFTCENVEIRKSDNNYFNVYFEKNTTATYMSPLYLGINASSVMSESQQETNDKLNESIEQDKEQHDEFMNSDLSEEDKQKPNQDGFDSYQESENELKDKMEQADLNNMSIGIDANSSSWIWDTLTRLIQSHSVVFGMFIAILSIGIIKLALGR